MGGRSVSMCMFSLKVDDVASDASAQLFWDEGYKSI